MVSILHQFHVKAQAGKVFDAFAMPEGLINWWPAKASGSPKLNQRYTFWFAPEYDWAGEVIHVVPGREITWKMSKVSRDWLDTEVGVVLADDTNGTRIDFFHRHWREANEHYRISNFCWAILLQGLKQYVETGVVVPFEDRP